MDTPRSLLQEMKDHVAAIPRGEEKVVPAAYAARIAAVGDVPFLLALFGEFSDATLTSWMLRLTFWWKDLPFGTWRELLRSISGDATLLYQFVWIASRILGIDAAAMIRSDPAVSDVAREYLAKQLAGGVPASQSVWFVEICQERGIDYWSIWTRLAAEGAPMNVDMAAGPRRLDPED